MLSLPILAKFTCVSIFYIEKTLMLGKTEGRRRKGTTEDEMVGWDHWFNGQEFEQTPGDGEGQTSLACCSPWGCKESDLTERKQLYVLCFENPLQCLTWWLAQNRGSITINLLILETATRIPHRQSLCESLVLPLDASTHVFFYFPLF